MQETDNTSHEFRDGDRLGVLAVQTAEIKRETETLIPEISPERAATYEDRDPNKVYLFECGDDRGITDESAEKLAQELGVEKYAMLRGFGGLFGVARTLGVAVAIQYGPEALKAYGGDLEQFAMDLKSRVESTSNVKLVAHSAEANEDNATQLNPASEKGIGCAYCAAMGGVCGLCQADSPLIPLARTEQAALFGDDSLVDQVSQGNSAFEQHFFPTQGKNFAITRSSLIKSDVPTLILAGQHENASSERNRRDKKIVVVENFQTDKVSNPNRAIEAGVPFYNNDVTATAEMLIKAYPELKLSPAILLAVMDQDIRAVRAALADHEGLNAEDLPLERNGDPKAAISYLESLVLAA